MAIRFQCGSCRQPIEIDDEWASKLVACPYCRKTITAPAVSQLDEPDRIPTATPLRPPTSDAGEGTIATQNASLQDHPNRIAIVAFALSCLMVVQVFAFSRIARDHEQEFQALIERTEELQKEGVGAFAANQQALLTLATSGDGTFPAWLLGYSLLPVGMIGCWLGALACGLIGVRRPRNRRWAVASLALAFLIVILKMGGG